MSRDFRDKDGEALKTKKKGGRVGRINLESQLSIEKKKKICQGGRGP